MLKGVALVVGNGNYQFISKLPNPENDSHELAKLLTDLGFDAQQKLHRDRARLERDLRDLADDATGCDVALLYYAGHGIEAGGENFLVPVDADIESLEAAADRMVPVSGTIARLRKAVPVVIVVLDACRNNPFPPDVPLRVNPRALPHTITAGGLREPRFQQQGPASQLNLGTVIGFAAAPGKTALDGPKGGNSPYTAALVRHLSAMQGEEFGTVMRMVTEEVYLKTKGYQQPWINQDLRRFLYFGKSPSIAADEDGEILVERRKLLLTISTTPLATRGFVESLAKRDELPLDQLYGMLKELKVDTSAGVEDLDAQLRAGAINLKKFMAERAVPVRIDPDLVRLSGLADRAQAEGAIGLAKDYRARASARADELRTVLDRREDELKVDRLQLAWTYAQHAETATLAFDHHAAAKNYANAFVQAEKWDAAFAASCKLGEAEALLEIANRTDSAESMARALQSFAQALISSEAAQDETVRAEAQNGYANAMQILYPQDEEKLSAAIRSYEAALTVFDRGHDLQKWLSIQNNLATAMERLGRLRGLPGTVEDAETIIRTALSETDAGGFQVERVLLLKNLANLLKQRWQESHRDSDIDEAIAAYRSALAVEELAGDRFEWAKVENNLGLALQAIAEERADTDLLLSSIKSFEMALTVRTRAESLALWATTMNNLGYARLLYGRFKQDLASVEEALRELHEANLGASEIGGTRNQAYVKDSLGMAYLQKHALTGDPESLEAARKYLSEAIAEFQDAGNLAEARKTREKIRSVEGIPANSPSADPI